MRSIRQTFRRPQLIAPIIVFPTILLAIQTGGAGGAVELPGFPPVQSFLQFMLAGAMMQSLMLAGNSGGIALAVDIEMGFTDRLFAAPIPRFAIVLGRLAGTAALGLFGALWFLAIGLIFGAEIESGVAGALLAIALVTAAAMAVGGIGAAIALRTGSASVVQGLFPLVLVVLFISSAFFPQELMIEPAKTIAEYNPLSFIAEGVREPMISGIDAADTLYAVLAILGIVVLGLSSAPAPCATGCGWADGGDARDPGLARQPGDDRRPDGAGQERADPGAGGGDPRGAGADDLLPRAERRLRRPDPAARLRNRRVRELHRPGQHAAGGRLHRRRRRGQPRPRHRTGLARPPAGLPRPALGAAGRDRARGQRPGADPGHLRASRSRLALGAGWPGVDGLLVTFFMVAAMAAVAACWGSFLALRFKSQSAAPLMQAGMMALILTTTAYAPLALLQGWLQDIARVNPVTQVVEAARQGFVGSVTWAETWPGLLALAGLLARARHPRPARNAPHRPMTRPADGPISRA